MPYEAWTFNSEMKLLNEEEHFNADAMMAPVSPGTLNMSNHKLFTTKTKGVAEKTFLD